MNMIERVAKAIYEADDVWSEAFPWPTMASKEQSPDEYRRIARAAIEAMREPTDGIIKAGVEQSNSYPAVPPDVVVKPVHRFVMTVCYRAMIDAALQDDTA